MAVALGTVIAGPVPDPADTASTQAAIAGTVRVAGSRSVVADATIFVIPDSSAQRAGAALARRQHLPPEHVPKWLREAQTDANGGFAIDGIVDKRVRVVVTAPGYERMEMVVELPTTKPLRLYVIPDSASAYRTVVTASRPTPAARVTSHQLSKEEIATLPGTQGDPLRALQNLPGVARAPGGLGLLVLRGAAPNQSRVFYGEHALPRAFHSFALASIVPGDAMKSIDFMPSNAPARYGETTGGVVAIEPAQPDGKGFHGHGKLDLVGAGAFVRGPAGSRGAFVAGATHSWIDSALTLANRIDPRSSYLLPRYLDYQAIYSLKLKGGGRLEARALGARDLVESRRGEPGGNGDRVSFGVQTQFHRADLVHRQQRGAWRTLLTPSVRVEINKLEQFNGDGQQRVDIISSWRAEAERRLSPRASLMVGADTEVRPYRTKSQVTTMTSLASPEDAVVTRRSGTGLETGAGLYTIADVRFGAVQLWPSLRFNAFTLGSDSEVALDPRFAGRWSINDRWQWSFGVGVYSQPVVQQRLSNNEFVENISGQLPGQIILPASFSSLEPRAGFDPVANDVRVARAGQLSTSVRFEPTPRWAFEAAAYARLRGNADGTRYVGAVDEVELQESQHTYDLAYGLELIARRQLVGKLYGWVAYTLSRSETRFFDALGRDDTPRTGDLDQRHILAVVGSYVLPKRWRIGGRFRLVSGSPYTDVVGTVVLPSVSFYLPVEGQTNGARFPTFHQLDLRVDKRWVAKRVVYNAYLDIQNVYNRANVEAYFYDNTFQRRFSALGLPILPTIGFRIDF